MPPHTHNTTQVWHDIITIFNMLFFIQIISYIYSRRYFIAIVIFQSSLVLVLCAIKIKLNVELLMKFQGLKVLKIFTNTSLSPSTGEQVHWNREKHIIARRMFSFSLPLRCFAWHVMNWSNNVTICWAFQVIVRVNHSSAAEAVQTRSYIKDVHTQTL